MSLVATLSPSSMVLAGNPVRLDISSDTDSQYEIFRSSTSIYKGSGSGSYFVYLQDIISEYLTPSVLLGSSSNILIPVSGNGLDFTVEVTNEDEESRTINFKAYLGGLSRSVLRSLNNSNPFTARFLSATGNIFFSLRERNGMIVLRETELCPLLFIYPPSGSLSVQIGQHSYSVSGTSSQLYGLNIERLRRQEYDSYGIIANTFILKLNGSTVTTIVITSAITSRNRYYLRYLNSLGAYDIIDLEGIAERSLDQSDESTYDVFDMTVDGYQTRRQRQPSRILLSINTGFMEESRMLLLSDMVCSSDVTLLGYGGGDIKVIPSAGNMTLEHNAVERQGTVIQLLSADEEQLFSTDNVSEQLGSGSLHSTQFTHHFI